MNSPRLGSEVPFTGEDNEPGAEVLPVLLHGLLQLLLSRELGDGVARWPPIAVEDDANRLAHHRLNETTTRLKFWRHNKSPNEKTLTAKKP